MSTTTILSRGSARSESQGLPSSTRFLGRQPIMDGKLKVYGHELLFRAGPQNAFSGDEEEATRQVIDNCLLLIPDVKHGYSFVNCTSEALLSGIVRLLPPTGVVLEILETVEPNPELLACIHTLRHHGYRFALDDFSPDAGKSPFLECVDYIKIDFLASDAPTRQQIYKMASHLKKIQFIAEKVESATDVQTARAEGCGLFQGYFFSKPVITESRVIPQNRLIYLQLLGALSRTPANLTEVERLVNLDASICYRLLRLVNSALFWLPHTVKSVRNALLMVGDDEMRKLVTVALTSAMASDRPALILLALERAKFCELLAPVLREDPSRLYLLGMLSLMDAFLGLPMSSIVGSLPLDEEMKEALLGEGSLTKVLKVVGELEVNSSEGNDHQTSMGLTDDAASLIRLESTCWADAVMYA